MLIGNVYEQAEERTYQWRVVEIVGDTVTLKPLFVPKARNRSGYKYIHISELRDDTKWILISVGKSTWRTS